MGASCQRRRRFAACSLFLSVFVSNGAFGREASLRGLEQEGEGDSDHWMMPKADVSDITAQTAEGRDHLYNIFMQALDPPGHKSTDPPNGGTLTASPTAGLTESPTASPTAGSTESPTASPTVSPTANPTASPTTPLTESPTASPTPGSTEPDEPTLTYEPGVFSNKGQSSDGLIALSNGLSAKPIADVGEPVSLKGGTKSDGLFHKDPDAAAVFALNGGGWLYVSNAENEEIGESWNNGGVGLLEFDTNGEVIGYHKIVSGTVDNCGGGVSPWNSWISGEETEGGQMVQVDPYDIEPPRYTAVGSPNLGKYESFAYDDETEIPTFYSTRDDDAGLITRFTPDKTGYECYLQPDDYDRWCTLEYGDIDYLFVNQDGTVEWTTDLNLAMANSERYHKNAEGINIHHGTLYFTAKEDKLLLIVDLRNLTYEVRSTFSKEFNEQPDQIYRIPGDESGDLYFCEDGGRHPGLHVMNSSGQMYTILHAEKKEFPNDDETTGVATSPDARHLYVSFQHVGIIYDVTRDDGRPFTDPVLSVEYH